MDKSKNEYKIQNVIRYFTRIINRYHQIFHQGHNILLGKVTQQRRKEGKDDEKA